MTALSRTAALSKLASARIEQPEPIEGNIAIPVAVVDALLAPAPETRPAALRDELLMRLAEYVQRFGPALPRNGDVPRHGLTGDCAYLARAIAELDRVARAQQAETAAGQPQINVERLASDVWNAAQEPEIIGEHFPGFATQDGFAATAIADVAANAVRKVLG